ncbi:autotransporter outer membrane beta-barrel domain-containing protein [Haemophilus parainfluenzae]|uniref:Putative pertactin family virulence factor, outer membrane autotransporter/Type V secretory pathway,adhesin AidA n=1 Tax=Haemophilus parainfluenzae TaxID=729 RepID=A0A377JJS2_HAEPA|nr:autotransporter outer membrane beta-barrel domain-containing protein [Haemophilus parainfluenzae]MBS6284608.1 pertactin family autotransporter [Haemophilus parainfluenzae]STP05298.1 putative pertactin family virulence factor, outer membrane autotransporter/Type V secretory pathway,adhesin AidA [Haemophilus parainfluenzae]
MKNNKIFNRTFKVSLVAMGLGLVNSAWATDLTCSNSTGCQYSWGASPNWTFNKNQQTSISDAINVTITPGNYQNTAKTDVGTRTDGGQPLASSDSLFSIFDLTDRNNHITVKSGVNATLKEDYPSSSLLDISGAVATFEKGSKLIIEKNYAQIHNITDAYGDSSGNSAIESRGGKINTQADIEINNDGSSAIESQKTSVINSSNHSIKMNGKSDIAYALYGAEDIANISNVQITGNQDMQFAFDIGTDEENALQTIIANGLNVTLNNKSGLFTTSDSGSQTITLTNSESNTGYGLLAFPLGEDQLVKINLENTTLNATQALISLNDKNFPIEAEEGDDALDPKAAGVYHLNLTASKNSKLTGAILENPDSPVKNEISLSMSNSQWSFNKSSTLNNLDANSSEITFTPTSEYKTLTIKDNLTGSSTFNLNTNITENKSDKIVVKGTAEGNHKIGVTNQGANVANGKVTLVETNGGNAAFSLTNPNNRVDLGAYQYFLTKEGNNWVLANSKNAVTPTPPVAPVTPNKPVVTPSNPVVTPSNPVVAPSNPVVTPSNPVVTPSNPVATPSNPVVPPAAPVLPSTPLLSDLANAQVSLRQAQLLLVEDDLSGIHQRLGEVKNGEKGNVWVRNVNSRQKLAALSTGESETSGFKQNVYSLQVGADAAVTDNLRVGGFVGRSQANVDFNGYYGDGKVRSNSVGLYAAYLADNGIYVDNIVKYSRLYANSDHTEKRHYNAYTISSELGKRFSLASDWTITPQAQLAWTHISSQKNEDSLSSVYSRIGLRVAKGFALSNGWNLQPYAEVNAITSKNRSSKIHYTNSALDVASSRGRFESAVGLNAGFANHRFGLEVSRADGKNFDKPYAIQAVYRYQW